MVVGAGVDGGGWGGGGKERTHRGCDTKLTYANLFFFQLQCVATPRCVITQMSAVLRYFAAET